MTGTATIQAEVWMRRWRSAEEIRTLRNCMGSQSVHDSDEEGAATEIKALVKTVRQFHQLVKPVGKFMSKNLVLELVIQTKEANCWQHSETDSQMAVPQSHARPVRRETTKATLEHSLA